MNDEGKRGRVRRYESGEVSVAEAIPGSPWGMWQVASWASEKDYLADLADLEKGVVDDRAIGSEAFDTEDEAMRSLWS